MSAAVDGLDIAVCVFDADDCALLWNRSFIKFFPEHAGHIHTGESYRNNLRRFYEGRLDATELPSIDRYIEEGVTRHRQQQRPYAFVHRGVTLTVSSLPLPGIGSVRVWRADAPVHSFADPLIPGRAGSPVFPGAELFDHVPDGVMVTTADGHVIWVNDPFVAMYGMQDRDAANGLDLEQCYEHAWRRCRTDDLQLFEAGLALLKERMRFSGAPFELPLPRARWARVIGQVDREGRRFFAHVDITALKRQHLQLLAAEQSARQSEAALEQKSKLLEATLERMEQGVMMVNADRVVEVCNRRAVELLGLPPELMAARPSFEAVLAFQWATDEFVHTPKELQEFVRAGGILDQPHRYDRRRPDGRVIEVQSVPISGGGVLRTFNDITERKSNEERIRHVSRHDGLTSLVNREVFLEYLAGAAHALGRDHEGFAVHYIDLDGFKPINDRFGHVIGDKVLALTAARMREIARDLDVVARMGGDEFAVLQYGVDRIDKALGMANRILEGVNLPMEIESVGLQLGSSIGIRWCPGAGEDPDTLLRHADAAMYLAKAGGRNRVCVYNG